MALRIAAAAMYVPAMLILIGISCWWFQSTETHPFDNPILFILWDFVRVLPGIIGLAGIMCGPMFAAGLIDWMAHERSHRC